MCSVSKKTEKKERLSNNGITSMVKTTVCR